MSLFGEKKTVHLDVAGMHCGSCVGKVEKALKGVPGVRRVDVSLEKSEAVVVADASTEPAALLGAVDAAGYEAREHGTPA